MHASLYGAIFINVDCTKLELQEVQDYDYILFGNRKQPLHCEADRR